MLARVTPKPTGEEGMEEERHKGHRQGEEPPSPTIPPVSVAQGAPSVKLYRLPLPESCVAFTSDEGKTIFTEAIKTAYMNCYYRLSPQLRTQNEPTFCGPASLVMVLNALSIDPGSLWKRPFKWYDEDMLNCFAASELVRKPGCISLDEFLCLAECNSLNFHAVPVDDLSDEDTFRALVKHVMQTEDTFLVVRCFQAALGQVGGAKFAPVSGYHPGRDMVLILDTARFQYPPYWVSLPALFSAVKAVRQCTGSHGGYVKLCRAEDTLSSLAFKVSDHFGANARPELVAGTLRFLLAWQHQLHRGVLVQGKDPLLTLVSISIGVLVEAACSHSPGTPVLAVRDLHRYDPKDGMYFVVQDLLLEMENTALFKLVSQCVRAMPEKHVAPLKGVLGQWPARRPCVKAEEHVVVELDDRLVLVPSVNLESCLGLSHLLTLFFLAWPFSLEPPAIPTHRDEPPKRPSRTPPTPSDSVLQPSACAPTSLPQTVASVPRTVFPVHRTVRPLARGGISDPNTLSWTPCTLGSALLVLSQSVLRDSGLKLLRVEVSTLQYHLERLIDHHLKSGELKY